jgi:MscS family membrane protein
MTTTIVRRTAAALLLVLLPVSLLPATSLSGQTPLGKSKLDTAAASAQDTTEEQVSPASPRASLERWLELTRAGEYDEAATYLDLPDSLRPQGPALARQLKAVLDRHVWFDLQEISPLAAGDTADGLSGRTEQIAEIRGARGDRQPVRLTRSQHDGETRWRFARATVARIPAWYAALGDRWFLEHLPAALLRPGPFDLLLWQWAALPVILVVAAGIGLGISRVLRSVFGRIARRTSTEWDDALLARLAGPLTVACTLAAAAALLPALGLYAPAAAASYRVLRAGFLLVFFWSLWRLVDVGRQVAAHTPWARAAASSRSLIPLGARVTKAIVLAFAAVAILSLLGYPVASLIAGLGLGGLAFALAAQKTVENLFGAFSIGVDQPFREGDFVKVEDFVGNVEAIGLRSTRFRTLDRTIITIPNGRLADMRVESFAPRDRLRFTAMIGLVYETTASQMREVLSGFERALRNHPKIWPEAITVRFRELGASSLTIEVMAWFQTADWNEFLDIRQDLLLQFMEIVERAGTGFAFPTSTVHVASLPATTGTSNGGTAERAEKA